MGDRPLCCASSGMEAVYLYADGYEPGGPCPRCGQTDVPFTNGRLGYHYPPADGAPEPPETQR